MHLNQPRDHTKCVTPYLYYTCASDNYLGCCAVDACIYHGCPASATQPASTATSLTGPLKPSAAPSASASTTDSNSQNATTTTQSASQAAPTSQSPSSTLQQASPASPTTSGGGAAPTSSQVNPQTSPTSTSSQAPVIILITSSVFITPTSNGVTLPATQSLITSTFFSSAANVPKFTSPSDGGPTLSDTSSKTPIIAGVVGGLGAISVIALLLGLLWRWRRVKTRAQENGRHAYDNDPTLEGIDANRAGDTFGRLDDMYRASPGAGNHQSFVSSAGSAAGTDSNQEKRSPVSPMHPHIPGPVPNTPELTGTSANDGFTELPPDPERLAINQPNQTSKPPVGQGASTQIPGSFLFANSNLPLRNNEIQAAAANTNKPHVLSWMDYNSEGSGGMGSKL